MIEERHIIGHSIEEICQKLAEDIAQQQDMFQYRALLQHQQYPVYFQLDIDLGGGFESGISTTLFSAALQQEGNYRFSLQQQGLLEEVGKLLGMQDVKVGHPEFDAHTLVQTNNEAKVIRMLSQPDVRQPLLHLSDYKLELYLPEEPGEPARLDLWIQEAITDPGQLCQLYHTFLSFLVFATTDKEL
ncbi:hypothetical protein FVR03_05775 [Pontibacter qinzhouensis]|uniref:Uncharacterized protein n=1 Tax=Pontibacter qinzhouensis TaxID=2603253 RepID=A0A5C8KBE6_9BACT|nr:hypothetical protein [Pontibacter qinzhouensis]TXK49828.1 hypothetical protein FVR03_05775 [Pontibacter qinzhouensis]